MNVGFFDTYYSACSEHKAVHQCGGVPYEHGKMLSVLVRATHARKILEVGTGLGYTSAWMAYNNSAVFIDTIDQDQSHLDIAQEYWQKLELNQCITPLLGKAEGILQELNSQYDFIFFDGYVPQIKMLDQFERLLKSEGTLVSANLFLRDEKGGKYLRRLRDESYWNTEVFSDTAVSVRL